jgi:hypothetical protein
MDRSELERQKAAKMRERWTDVLAWTRNSDVGDQSDDYDNSHGSVDNKVEVVCHPNETYGMTEEILEDPPKPITLLATQILNLTRRISDEVLKIEELASNNSAVIPNPNPNPCLCL